METAVQPEGRAGKLTIFAGYMSGIGTAAAMLRAADRARQSGTDVVAGAAISCECPEARSFEGLWQAENPERLDLDAALRRKPGLLLVENLAYRNQEGRHKKRHQDVEELLNAGIDVFTTLDIPHLESLQDRVAAILGSPVSDRIPDRVFDQADRVELVDMDPRDLREQLGDWDARSPSSAPCGSWPSAAVRTVFPKAQGRGANRRSTGLVNTFWCAFRRRPPMQRL